MSNGVGASLIGLIPTILALGVTVQLLKTFQGKEFELDGTFSTKKKAQRRAQELRKKGFLARVSKESNGSKNVWAVFKRGERESDFSLF